MSIVFKSSVDQINYFYFSCALHLFLGEERGGDVPVPAISISSSLAIKEQSVVNYVNFYMDTEQLYLLGDKWETVLKVGTLFFCTKMTNLGTVKDWELLSCYSRFRMSFFPVSPIGNIGSIK